MPYVSLCIITLWYCRNIRQLRWNYWYKQCWLMLCHETHCPGSVLGLDQLTPNGKKTCSKVRIFQEINDFPLCYEKRTNVLQGASRWMRVWFSRSINLISTVRKLTISNDFAPVMLQKQVRWLEDQVEVQTHSLVAWVRYDGKYDCWHNNHAPGCPVHRCVTRVLKPLFEMIRNIKRQRTLVSWFTQVHSMMPFPLSKYRSASSQARYAYWNMYGMGIPFWIPILSLLGKNVPGYFASNRIWELGKNIKTTHHLPSYLRFPRGASLSFLMSTPALAASFEFTQHRT